MNRLPIPSLAHVSSVLASGRQRSTLTIIIRDQVTNKRPMLPVTTTVTDVTGSEDSFTLDQNGFQYLKHVSEFASQGKEAFADEEKSQKEYFAECEELLKDV